MVGFGAAFTDSSTYLMENLKTANSSALINANSGKALDDTSGSTQNGNPMQQYTISGPGNSNQQWQIVSLGNGYYNIVNRTSGLVLDLTNGNTDDGTTIQQWSGGGSNPNQSWQFELSQ